MGKQDPSTGYTSQKVLDAPCSELYQASLKCELSCCYEPAMHCLHRFISSEALDMPLTLLSVQAWTRTTTAVRLVWSTTKPTRTVSSRRYTSVVGYIHQAPNFCGPCCISCLDAFRLRRARSADLRLRRARKGGFPEILWPGKGAADTATCCHAHSGACCSGWCFASSRHHVLAGCPTAYIQAALLRPAQVGSLSSQVLP